MSEPTPVLKLGAGAFATGIIVGAMLCVLLLSKVHRLVENTPNPCVSVSTK